ncbi:MAG: hypothetical protein FWE37_07110 [Spirochaetaceae bacterium]|nr:hypothetical protein [Spirochaetaceae bacterium]
MSLKQLYLACFLGLFGMEIITLMMRLQCGIFQPLNLLAFLAPLLALGLYKGWFWLIALAALSWIWGIGAAQTGFFLLPLFMLRAKKFTPQLTFVTFFFITANAAAQLLLVMQFPVLNTALVVAAYTAVFIAVAELREFIKNKKLIFALYIVCFIIALALTAAVIYFYGWAHESGWFNVLYLAVPLFIAALHFKSLYIIIPTIILWLWAFTATGGAGIILALLFAAKLKDIREYALLLLFTTAVLATVSIITDVHISLFIIFILAGAAVFLAVLQFKGLLALVDENMVVSVLITRFVYLTNDHNRIFRLCYVEEKQDKEVPLIIDGKEVFNENKVAVIRREVKRVNNCTTKELAASVKAGAVKIVPNYDNLPE